jgi:hypothetical protein
MSSTSIKNPNVSELVFSYKNPHLALDPAYDLTKKLLSSQNIDYIAAKKEELKSEETKTRVSEKVLAPESHFLHTDHIKTSKESNQINSKSKLIETSSDVEDAQDSSSELGSSDESPRKSCV